MPQAIDRTNQNVEVKGTYANGVLQRAEKLAESQGYNAAANWVRNLNSKYNGNDKNDSLSGTTGTSGVMTEKNLEAILAVLSSKYA